MTKWHIYPDGSCLNNGRINAKGGAAAIILEFEGDTIKSGFVVLQSQWTGHVTNNRMEIIAATIGMRALPLHTKATLFSDSEYLVNIVTKGWTRKSNEDVWEEFYDVYRVVKPKIEWVRGHAKSKWNNLADQLALAAVQTKTDYHRRQITYNEYMTDEEFIRAAYDVAWGRNKAVTEKSLKRWDRLSTATRAAIIHAAQHPLRVIHESFLRDGHTWFVSDEFFLPAEKTPEGWNYRLTDKGFDLYLWVATYGELAE